MGDSPHATNTPQTTETGETLNAMGQRAARTVVNECTRPNLWRSTQGSDVTSRTRPHDIPHTPHDIPQ